MDISKLRAVDILNPKKWREFAKGTYYEETIGYYRVEQLIYYLYKTPDQPEILGDVTETAWSIFKQQTKLSIVAGYGDPEDYDKVQDRIPEHFKDVELWYAEQVIVRSTSCRQCLLRGSCEHCGCTMPDSFMSPTNWCSIEIWKQMYEEPTWKYFRKINQTIMLCNNTI